MAATSTLKLVLDDKEYEASLKSAKQGMQALQQSLEVAGKSFADVDKTVVEYARSIGEMASTAKGTKGQLRDMSQTLTDITTIYRQMTDAERQSPFGQAMASSIEQLTQRAGDLRDTMDDVTASIQHSASDTQVFDRIAGGVGLLTSGLQTATGAAKLLGVSLGDNVEVIAKLQAAMAVTSGLKEVQALLQKQSALMMGINVLQTQFNILARANPYVLLATGVAAVAGALALWAKNGEAAKIAQAALNKEIDHTKNLLSQLDKDTDFSVGIAEAAGKSWEEIHRLRLEAARTKLELADLTLDKIIASGGSKEQVDKAMQMSQAAWDNVVKILSEGTIHDVRMRSGNGRGGSGGGGVGGVGMKAEDVTGLINVAEKRVADLQRQINSAMSTDEIDRLNKELEKAQQYLRLLRGDAADVGTAFEITVNGTLPPLMKMQEVLKGLNEQLDKAKTPEQYQSILSDIKSVNKEMSAFKGDGKKTTDTKKVNTTQEIGKLISSVESIGNSLNLIGVEIPKGFSDVLGGMQAVITILEAIQTIQTVGSILGLFGRGGIVKAASGMVVPGTSFGYDGIPSLLTSGEIVLNRAQQGVIASALQDSSQQGGMQMQPYVMGEQVFLGANTYTKRIGQGEIVTTRMLKSMGLIN